MTKTMTTTKGNKPSNQTQGTNIRRKNNPRTNDTRVKSFAVPLSLTFQNGYFPRRPKGQSTKTAPPKGGGSTRKGGGATNSTIQKTEGQKGSSSSTTTTSRFTQTGRSLP